MKKNDRNGQIQISLCRTSKVVSMTAMIIVITLELFMLGYTVANAAMYGPFIWRYRSFYIFLLSVAVIYMSVNRYARKDIEKRYEWMNVANPLCAVLFYAWSLAVTYSDFSVTGIVDTTVFMTFSMVVPLGFYLRPRVYGIIVGVADAIMLWMILKASGVGAIINAGVFFIFQIVLGINYMRMKIDVAERIVEEQENALIDVLTGCPNRRAYENEIKALSEEALPSDLTYVATDLNGLKEVNDSLGHEAGDRVIIGAARCIESSFGKEGKAFRTGGDEFVVLINAGRKELKDILSSYEAGVKSWAEENMLPLSVSYGYACSDELSGDKTIIEIARMADSRMYQAKAQYYLKSGNDRRKYLK